MLLLLVLPAHAATRYVRPDGGTPTQCTGATDAPYPGSGSGLPCAWDHPFRALPPDGSPARIAGGDTLVIGSGAYRMGLGAPGADGCDPFAPWDCRMPAPPSGPDAAQPTRVVGAGWDAGCPDPPELWGADRAAVVVELEGVSHLQLACLEITDRSSCIEHHADPAYRCARDAPPYGDWAAVGIHAADSAGVLLSDLDVHGLAAIGIHAGRLTDWTVERSRIAANGWAGWDGDLWDGDDGNQGALVFRQLEVAWNGCAEDPSADAPLPASCWSQTAGGYGDGFAAGTSGGSWTFQSCRVHHNTSDGIDLLYLDPTAAVTVDRLEAHSNAGNPLKVAAGVVEILTSVLVADCAAFEGTGQVDPCRAAGNALALALHPGGMASVHSSTVTGQGDCLLEATCAGGGCDGSEQVVVRNTLLAGQTDWAQPWQRTCLAWSDPATLPADPLDLDWSLVWHTEGDPCPGADSVCGQDPRLVSSRLEDFDAHLLPGSPAADAGSASGAPAGDLAGTPRDAAPDIGAYELASTLLADGFESGDLSGWTSTVWITRAAHRAVRCDGPSTLDAGFRTHRSEQMDL